MRVAVLIKQIPRPDQLRLLDGRLVREGVELEVNAYCRRANAKAVELAGPDGEVVVFTMGPPSAGDALREMLACDATRAVHLCDLAFAGSDTLATARTLATAIRREGPFDLVLCGLNSLDSDTGQVGPELAELLGLPFAPGARELMLHDGTVRAKCETDDGYRWVTGDLPLVLSTAERLCDPSKAAPSARAQVSADRLLQLGAEELGLSAREVGAAGSPTSVGPVRVAEVSRRQRVVRGAAEAIEALAELGAFDGASSLKGLDPVPETGGEGPAVWCFLDPADSAPERELIGEAAGLAARLSGSVTVVTPEPAPPGLGAAGADRVLLIPDATEPEQWANALARASADALPWALLVDGTRTGRAVASLVAARNGWGLTGDAIGLEVSDGCRLVALKPAFGGQLVAPIESSSPVQVATVRPGVLPRRLPRSAPDPVPELLPAPGRARICTTDVVVEDPLLRELLAAQAVVGVGTGVAPDEYVWLDPLRELLGGAPLGATRKVTDRGWLPRSRQIGVTGHAIGPELYVAVGLSGKLNHMIGVRNSKVLLAINEDVHAEVFRQADVGLVGDWKVLVPELASELRALHASTGDLSV
ncbi:MAG: FAD-binding protein [Acidimicrobiales bacterium]